MCHTGITDFLSNFHCFTEAWREQTSRVSCSVRKENKCSMTQVFLFSKVHSSGDKVKCFSDFNLEDINYACIDCKVADISRF